MVDTSGFKVGDNLAATPGAVVFRSEVLEVIQYTPQTETVRSVPLLVVPPTINKFYAIDLAPERSLVEFLVRSGQQVFMISWRNPDARHADWGLATYVHAVVDALSATQNVTGADRTLVAGACSGGIIAATTLSYLAGRGDLERIAGLTLLVTVIDSAQAGDVAALTDGPHQRSLADAAKAMSRRTGYVDGRKLAEVFAWLRPATWCGTTGSTTTSAATCPPRSTSSRGTPTRPGCRRSSTPTSSTLPWATCSRSPAPS